MEFEGLKNGETVPSWEESPKFVTAATMTSSVGDYSIAATAKPKNYELSTISDGVLTVLPAKLNVIVQNKSRLYYEENPPLTFYYSGFRNGETESIVSNAPSLTTSATLDSNSGKYDISISDISAPNYEIQYKYGVLTIIPRNLSVKTGIYQRVYGEENPEFELTYDGFVAGQNQNDLTTVPHAYTTANKTSSVGSYPIYIGGGNAQNYIFNYEQGNLNIIQAEQIIVWNQDLSHLSVGEQVELLAYSTSGLPVVYAMESNNVCEIYSVGNKKYLDCLKEGEIQIKASQDGNSNYNSTPRVSKKVVVESTSSNKPTLTITQLPIGSMSSQVERGSIHTFTIKTNEGWSVNAISINGEDYTDKIDSNGTITTPAITEDINIIISYYDENSGIEPNEINKVRILGQDNGIRILNAGEGKILNVYTLEGYLVKSITVGSDDVTLPLNNNNTYIVTLDKLAVKIRL